MMKAISIFLALLILFSGCLEKKEVKYVCPDGEVVEKADDCELGTTTSSVTTTTFITTMKLGTTTTTSVIITTTLKEVPSTTTSTTITSSTSSTSTTLAITTTYTSTIISTNQNIEISATQFDAPGDDRKNPEGEWVEITNEGEENVKMDGWTLEDEGGHIYEFPSNFILAKGDSVKIHAGNGEDTSSDLFWGYGKPIWNNDGDTATLKDSEGKIVDQKEG